MANKVLRPSGPSFGRYNNAWGVVPASFYWQAIDDIVEDGDTSYLFAEVDRSPFTVRFSTYSSLGFPRATRIEGLLVVATIRITPGVPVDFNLRLRCLDRDFDSAPISFSSTTYTEVYWWYPQLPNGSAWTSSILSTLEAGLVYISGGGNQLRCTKLEIHVVDDAIPDVRLLPDDAGDLNQWTVHPSSNLDYQVLGDPWDGDLAYIKTDQAGFKDLVQMDDLNPTSLNIEKVIVTAASRTHLSTSLIQPEVKPLLRIGGTDYSSGINTSSTLLPFVTSTIKYAWTLAKGEFYGDPSLAWPDGAIGGGPWTVGAVNSIQAGIENIAAEAARCTKVAVDIVLHPTPTSTFTLLPVSDSVLTQFHNIPGIVPVQAFPNIWQNVDEDPPDDAGSYIGNNATVVGFPVYGLFGVGPGFAVPAGEQLWAVQSSCRIELGSTLTALVALCVNDPITNELIIGPVQKLEGSGVTWFNLYHSWYTNPYTGLAWQSGEVEALEWGVVILDGEAFFSQVKVQAWTCPLWTTTTDVCTFDLTDEADLYINRSRGDGTVYAVTEFGVGTGGYNPATLVNVLPVVKADTSLTNEVVRLAVNQVTFEEGSPDKVTYWCRVPREAVVGYQVGEVGLYATILWSPIPAEIGYKFLWAIAHSPAIAIHFDDTLLYKLTVNYP